MLHRPNSAFAVVPLLTLLLVAFARPASGLEIESSFIGQPTVVTSDTSGSHTTTPGVPQFGLDHDGVGLMRITFTGGTIRCSGSLLTQGGRQWALTAAHCANGAISATMEFDTPGGLVVETVSTPSQITVHPNYNGDTFSGYDVALLEFDAPVDPTIPSYELNRSVEEVGEQIVMVGYGETGHGSTGRIPGTAGTKRIGLNRYEYQGVGGLPGGFGIFNNHTQLTWDFDSGLAANDAFARNYGFPEDLGFGDDEVGLAPGDSGGPSFINDGGVMKIAGVHSHGFLIGGHQGDYGGSLNFGWGEFQGDARINEASILSWIDSLAFDSTSNASFSSGSDVDVLNLDFGSVSAGSAASSLGFDVSNLAGAGITASLDLSTIVGSGDTTTLTTDLAPFTGLLAGNTNNYLASIDTSALGAFSASYDLSFTDAAGTNQTLTLNLSGEVEIVDTAGQPDLFYNPATGEVHLDPRDTGGLIGYVLLSDDQFLDANHTPVFTGGVVTSRSDQLAEATLTSLTTPGSLGLVLPAGLTLEQVWTTITQHDASTALGQPTVNFDFDLTCGTGDVNCDGFVDVSNDILPAFSKFTGPGTFSLLRSDGDVNGGGGLGDDDVDVSDLLDILSNFTGPPPDEAGLGGPAEAGDPAIPDLIYDAATGEVVLDPDGSSIIGYSLQNATNSFLPVGHTPILAGVTTALTSQLEEAALAPGSGSIGFVFPTGLNLAGLQALLTVNQVSRSLGAPLVAFDLVVLNAPTVPEPSAIWMAAVAVVALALLGARRRHAA
ncbi:MAG: hypothetical protein DWQ31_07050 [Planctomycetota bacterium]|nr:MAG: hypothetical protein DWQ31_07050 [Planctomycetota bacterium]REJ89552.1 MAG: hypothetical protein DWQ35_17845 [Planctomycetota bacterium]REK31415.1 MAG: hypothetical protein DWQ42_00355 [Planctomycetota bacterium]REK40645.1 MAG: hypothetical protein DWQ46_15495 [Planctomycetota bacterium]